MGDRMQAKVEQYETMLATGLEAIRIAAREDSPLWELGEEHREMAASYLEDGRHFLEAGDLPNALAAFSYGHGWLDAGVRSGLLAAPTDIDVFAIRS